MTSASVKSRSSPAARFDPGAARGICRASLRAIREHADVRMRAAVAARRSMMSPVPSTERSFTAITSKNRVIHGGKRAEGFFYQARFVARSDYYGNEWPAVRIGERARAIFDPFFSEKVDGQKSGNQPAHGKDPPAGKKNPPVHSRHYPNKKSHEFHELYRSICVIRGIRGLLLF